MTSPGNLELGVQSGILGGAIGVNGVVEATASLPVSARKDVGLYANLDLTEIPSAAHAGVVNTMLGFLGLTQALKDSAYEQAIENLTEPRCFVAGTSISLPGGRTLAIELLRGIVNSGV